MPQKLQNTKLHQNFWLIFKLLWDLELLCFGGILDLVIFRSGLNVQCSKLRHVYYDESGEGYQERFESVQ